MNTKTRPARLSLDNGNSYLSIVDLEDNAEEIDRLWGALREVMDAGAMERAHASNAPNDHLGFIAAYLEQASDDLVIG